MKSVARLAGLAPALLVLWASASAAAPLKTSLHRALEKARASSGAPAAQAAVMRCGRLLWQDASGVTDVGSRRSATTRTRFVLASTTKPVTAALVLDLVDQGKLSLSTPVSRFYPGLPQASAITIRMLLAHSSGLNEYFDDPTIADLIDHHPDHHWTRDEVLRGITRTRFTPGTYALYSNSGYVVLGGVIEKVTGESIESVFRRRIARPLHLTLSSFEYRPERSNLFAHPYVGAAGSQSDMFAAGVGVPADYWGPVWTDGGLASTASELARFGDALFEGSLLRRQTMKTMTRRNRFGQGLGVDRENFAGRTWLGHNGAYVGYASDVWHDAKRGLTIAVTSNQTPGSSTAIWHAIARAAPGGAPCHHGPS